MAQGTCSIDGCERVGRLRRGWCEAHYQQWLKRGDPLARSRRPAGTAMAEYERLASLETDACVVWTMYASATGGYGTIWINGRMVATHILTCGRRHGPRPSRKHVVCHSCDNPPCMNYRHLRWATQLENLHEAEAKGRMWQWGKTGWASSAKE